MITICNTNLFEIFIYGTAMLQFLQLPATIIASRMSELGWREDVKKLTALNRRIAVVMMIGVVLSGMGTGVIVIVNVGEIASGNPVGTSLALFLAVFWAFRGAVQIFVYPSVWPRQSLLLRLCHTGLRALLVLLTLNYFIIYLYTLLSQSCSF
jgi:hypothetical protein